MIRVLLTIAALTLGGAALAQEEATSGRGAILRGLDKVNGHTVDVEIFSGGTGAVFRMDVQLADCRYPPDNPAGEAFAYLTIRDASGPDIRFEGWMVATSPALNALDHSRYDVWVLRCITS